MVLSQRFDEINRIRSTFSQISCKLLCERAHQKQSYKIICFKYRLTTLINVCLQFANTKYCKNFRLNQLLITMSVKIFMPFELFYTKTDCEIFGEIHINENSVSYFVIATDSCNSGSKQEQLACSELRHLGSIQRSGPNNVHSRIHDVSLCFCYDPATANIYLTKLSITPAHVTHANVFLFDATKLLQLHCEPIQKTIQTLDGDYCDSSEQYDDIRLLFNLLERCDKLLLTKGSKRKISHLIGATLNFPLEVINKIFLILIECKAIAFIVKKTVFYEHYLDWQRYRDTGKRNYNITLDKLLGIFVMFCMLFYISHPGDQLMQAAHFVIKNVRLLLHALKGSPIGLKLNVHLNNFLLDCFSYHIDLWATFLSLIEPAVHFLFVPIALLGSMGLSYQLAMLSDLISILGLHAHCFYIYSAVLYKVEINGLQVLWKVVLGKRRNLLKNRVESHNYMNRQLYLATIFFTSLLFLFPTILVYYAVFTTLRLGIYLTNLVLKVKRRRILEFPLQMLLKWLSGSFFEIESLQLQHLEHVPSPLLQPASKQIQMSLFVINVQSSSLGRVFSCESGVLKEFSLHEQTSLSNIVQRILHGKF